tara:strand:+ start:585 stop:794 length:210 start_codon:yes stop_codon:yes gene_type:complete
MIKKNKKLALISLILSTFSAMSIFGSFPHDHIHPLFTFFSLLPLQLGALGWAYFNGHLNSFKIPINNLK